MVQITLISGEAGILEASIHILESLNKQERVKGYCPAYTSQLSLDIKGNVFPCFMSMSLDETNMGNLAEDNWPTEQSKRVFNRYREDMLKGQLASRHSIWFDSLVVGCAVADYLTNQHFGKDVDLDIHEAIVVGTILGLAQTQK